MIIVDRPPNFQHVLAAFPRASDPGVMFAYDGNIYNPSGIEIPPALIAHEQVHLNRQKYSLPDESGIVYGGPDYWWSRYLADPEFRYNEELLAHAAEFKTQRNSRDRNFGARLLMATALRLVAPLYNYDPPRTLQQALKDLQREIRNV